MEHPASTPPTGLPARLRGELAAFPPQFWLLAAGIALLMSGIDMCFPFETIYLTQHRGVSMTAIGLMLGLPLLAALPIYIIGGALVDRHGRKLGMGVGTGVIACLYVTFALAPQVWQIGIAIVIEAGFGWAFFLTASNAMVADLVVHERRAEAYSFTRIALACGMVIGPIGAGLLLTADPGFRTLFLTGAGLCAAFVCVMLLFFRETRPPAVNTVSLVEAFKGYGVVFRDRRYVAFCVLCLLPLYGFGQIWTNLPVALRERYGMPASTWSLLLITYAITMGLLQYPVIRAFRGANHFYLLATSSGCIGAGLAGAVLLPWGVNTYAFQVVLSLGIILLIPVTATVAAELAPVALRGRYMGAWTLVQEAGYALGVAVGGIVLQHLGARDAFAIVGLCGLAGALLFALTARTFAREPQEEPSLDLAAGTSERP